MSPLALALVLGSASIHALWNILYKNAGNKDAFAFLKTLGSLTILSLVACWAVGVHRPESTLWLRSTISGVGYAAFFIFLSIGYRSGDFTLVYPISRGVGPMLAAVGGVLILGERLSPIGLIGIGLVLLAVMALSLTSGEGKGLRGLRWLPVIAGCLVGLTIATYSVNDKIVQLPAGYAFAERAARSFLFLWSAVALSAVLLAIFLAAIGAWKHVLPTLRAEGGRIAIASVLDTASYGLYLLALSLPGSKTAYVTPVRSASVVIAAILGAVVLREKHPVVRFCAATVVLIGVICVSRAGW